MRFLTVWKRHSAMLSRYVSMMIWTGVWNLKTKIDSDFNVSSTCLKDEIELLNETSWINFWDKTPSTSSSPTDILEHIRIVQNKRKLEQSYVYQSAMIKHFCVLEAFTNNVHPWINYFVNSEVIDWINGFMSITNPFRYGLQCIRLSGA